VANVTSPHLRPLFLTTLKAGGQLQYDEEDVDSTALPTGYADSSASFKSSITNWQDSKWHVVITVPDSTKPYFKTVKTAYWIASRDTLAAAGAQIWQTVTYGTNYSSYDANGDLISSNTITVDSAGADLDDIPIAASQDSIVTDSSRNYFDSVLTANGQSVSTYGSSEIKSTSTFSAEGNMLSALMYFDKNYLTLDSASIGLSGGATRTGQKNTYSSQGGYRIATTTVTTQYPVITSSEIADFKSYLSTPTSYYNVDPAFGANHIIITTLSNIELP
jgi:hypothetical protein